MEAVHDEATSYGSVTTYTYHYLRAIPKFMAAILWGQAFLTSGGSTLILRVVLDQQMDAQPEKVVKAQVNHQESWESGEQCWTVGSDARRMDEKTALIISMLECFHFLISRCC